MSNASQAQLCDLQENPSIRKLQIDILPLRPLSACFPFIGLCWTLAGRAWQEDVDADDRELTR
jgi:hypothetical protein